MGSSKPRKGGGKGAGGALRSERLWCKSEEGAQWVNGTGILNDMEQSLIVFQLLDTEEDGTEKIEKEMPQPLFVAGLHEASVELSLEKPCSAADEEKEKDKEAQSQKNNPTKFVVHVCLRGSDDVEGQAVRHSIELCLSSRDEAISWCSGLKRASFPPGHLWGCRKQNIEDYAMSQLPCPIYGTVWKAESANTSVLVDSLRLCNLNPLSQPNNAESFQLLLRLKMFGCTLSMDKVLTNSDVNPAEVESLKTQNLRELLEFFSDGSANKAELDEIACFDLMEMISLNLIRPMSTYHNGLEEEGSGCSIAFAATEQPYPSSSVDLFQEITWTHLALVYDILLKFLSTNVCPLEIRKRCVREELCHDFVQLFRSSNMKEREYVKTITHCMYSRLVSCRGSMRRAMANSFLEFAFVSKRHNGIGEILEVFGSIASGFAVPIKDDHKSMLMKCLLPLYSVRGSEVFHEQLSFVVVQYITKEPDLCVHVLLALFKYWPWKSAAKQILFLAEVGEIASYMEIRHFEAIEDRFIRLLCSCISGHHFQVAEYAMGLLNNNYLYAMIFEHLPTRETALPRLVFALQDASASWNASVRQISNDIIDFLRNLDQELFDLSDAKCTELRANRRESFEVFPVKQNVPPSPKRDLLEDEFTHGMEPRLKSPSAGNECDKRKPLHIERSSEVPETNGDFCDEDEEEEKKDDCGNFKQTGDPDEGEIVEDNEERCENNNSTSGSSLKKLSSAPKDPHRSII